ncbi:MAG: translation initiation factor IF-6 [Candidatus Aenigmarchaeota archaeon]|nr:translation initiation factor IF-6 [Candidatus Aenigmarchaeota archaeon]
MQNILRTNFNGDPNLGLYGFATDKYCLFGAAGYMEKAKSALNVQVHHANFLNMDLVKLFCIGNSSGAIVAKSIRNFDEDAVEKIKSHIRILTIDTNYTSLGNLVLLNDKGIILSPLLRKHKKEIERFFGLECHVGKIVNMSIVGSLGFATNKGCLLHPKVKESEKRLIEKTLQVDSDITTVNFGSPYPGAGLIANSNGLLVSETTSGPELGRITDVLGFL